MATHSSILAWRIPWREEPGGLQPMGLQRVRHDWTTKHNTAEHWVGSPELYSRFSLAVCLYIVSVVYVCQFQSLSSPPPPPSSHFLIFLLYWTLIDLFLLEDLFPISFGIFSSIISLSFLFFSLELFFGCWIDHLCLVCSFIFSLCLFTCFDKIFLGLFVSTFAKNN